MYEISLSFRAPSRATGKLKPLPKYRQFLEFLTASAIFSILSLRLNACSIFLG